MVDKILKIILLFTPIAYCVGVDWYKFEIVYFQLSSIILFMAAMYDKPKRRFNIKKIISLFIGICLLSVIVNGFQNTSLSALINVSLACVSIFIITVYSKDLKKCFNWLLIGLGINTLIFIGQIFGYSPFIDPKTITGPGGEIVWNECGGIIGNAPRFAAFIALCLPFVNRLYLIPAFILAVLLKEVSVFFSIFVIFLYEVHKNNMAKTASIFFVIAFLSVLVFHKTIFQSFSIRFTVWKDLITHLAQRPLLGFGLGSYKLTDVAVSSFLQWIYGVGITGIAFIGLCLKRYRWYLLPLIFLCLFEYPFEIPRLYPLLICVVAYYAAEQKEDVLC